MAFPADRGGLSGFSRYLKRRERHQLQVLSAGFGLPSWSQWGRRFIIQENKSRRAENRAVHPSPALLLPPFIHPHRLRAEQRERLPSDAPRRSVLKHARCRAAWCGGGACVLRPRQQCRPTTSWGGTDGWRRNVAAGRRASTVGHLLLCQLARTGTLDSCWAWKTLDGQQTGASVALLRGGCAPNRTC